MNTRVKRERSSTPTAKRMRLFRQRRRDGEHLVRIHLYKIYVDALIKKRYLAEEDRANRAVVEGAADAFLGDKLSEAKPS